jgi:hypothetical protein
LWLFLSCIRDDDPTSGFCFGLDPTDENAVMQWTKCHVELSFFCFAIPPRLHEAEDGNECMLALMQDEC